jgi:hypothetical protein
LTFGSRISVDDDSKHDRDCNFSEGQVTAPGRSAEQGNLLKAKDDLQKVRLICGTGCKEYVTLKGVIDGTRTLLVR